MAKYFILGDQASTFWDPTTRTKIVTHDEGEAVEVAGPLSKRLILAIKNGHIKEVGKSAAPAAKKEEPKKAIEAMDDKELEDYYKNTYRTTKKDRDTFSKMSTEEKVKFLTSDEEDEE